MKKKLLLICLMLLVISCLALASCELVPPTSMQLIVDGEVYQTITVTDGQLDLSNITPTKNGYTFEGWYIDEALTIPLTTDNAYQAVFNGKLYSKWSKAATTDCQHTNAEWQTTLEPTCTQPGSKHKVCPSCNEELQVEAIPATGHSFGEWTTVTESTCTQKGQEERTCSCGEKETRDKQLADHSFGDWTMTKAATCTEPGVMERVCSCGEKETSAIKPTGHTEETLPAVDATCTTTGLTEGTKCSVCGTVIVAQQVVGTINHNYVDGKCTVCKLVDPAVCTHNAGDWIVDTPATCITEGSKHIECTLCKTVLQTEVIPVTDHNYTSVVTPPTCTEQGYTTHTCSVCSDSYVDTYVDATDHTEGAWIVDVEPGCTTEGSKHQVCATCGSTLKTESVDAFGHDEIKHSAQAPTCTAIGWDAYVTCSRCDYTTYKEIPATGHDYTASPFYDWSNDYSNCTATSLCGNNCGESKVVNATVTSSTTPATCTEKGFTTYTATFVEVGYTTQMQVVEIDVTGHNYENNVCTNCGDSIGYSEGLKYTLSEDETYYIVSKGDCTDADVIIPSIYNGKPVKNIDHDAFFNDDNLVSITIPASVTIIGDDAFSYCENLTTVTFEQGSQLISMGDYTFYLCEKLTTVTLEHCSQLISIGAFDFCGCSNITGIIITEKVTSIGDGAFSYCAELIGIDVDEDNANYKSIDGNLYSKDGKNLIQYAIGKADTSYEVINDTTNIGLGAFAGCVSLISITVSNSVTTIGVYAFENCVMLKSITIPSGVVKLEDGVFADCSELNTIIFEEGSQLESIGSNAFYRCYKLESIMFPASVISIGENAFSYCDSLTSIVIPESVISIGKEAFYGCDELTSVTFEGETCWYVAEEEGATSGIFVDMSDASQNADYLTGSIYYWYAYVCEDHTYDSVVTDPTCTEQGYTTHTCSVCGDSFVDTYVDALGHAFGEWVVATPATCTEDGLMERVCTCGEKEVEIIPAEMHAFGEWIIDSNATCTQDGNKHRTCPHCGETEYEFIPAPGHDYTFVVTPPTCTEQGYTTHNCNICGDGYVDSYVEPTDHTYENKVCTSCGAAVVSYVGASMIEDVCDELFEELQVVNSDNLIGNITFTTTSSGYIYWLTPTPILTITSAGIPVSYSDFGTYEFKGMTYYCYTTNGTVSPNMHTFNIYYACMSVCTTCGGCMDESCPATVCSVKCDCPKDVEQQSTAFSYVGSSAIEEVCDELFEELQVVEADNLYGLLSITTTNTGYLYWLTPSPIKTLVWRGVWTGEFYTEFDQYVYNGITYYCYTTNMELGAGTYEFIIPYACRSVCETCGGCMDIDCKAEDCSTKCYCEYYACLEFQISDDGTYYIVIGLAEGCEKTDIVIPSTYEGKLVKGIGSSAFMDCTSLTSITIPSSVISIGNYTFFNCTSLTDVKFEPRSQCTNIGDDAFHRCISLTNITIPESVTSIGSSTFYGCSSLQTITFEEASQCTNIGSEAFRNCGNLIEIIIPEGVTSIGDSAFHSCTNLTSITIPSSVTSIGEYAFLFCTSLTKVEISDLAAWCSIDFDNYADSQDPSVFNNYANPLEYAQHLFLNGEEVTHLVIPEGISSIGANVFCNCDSITSITIPSSVTSIGEFAFDACSNLTKVEISNLAAWCSIDFDNVYSNPLNYAGHLYLDGEEITELVIPEDVTSIGSYAFYYCPDLTSVTIPSSVTSIGYKAFDRCYDLVSVTFEGDNCWYVAETKAATTGTFLNLSDPTQNINYLKTQYRDYYWYTNPAGHVFGEWTVVNDATCTKDGQQERVCACGEKETEVIPAIGHNYENDVCGNCGDTLYSIGLDYLLSEDETYYIVRGIGDCTDTDVVIPSTHEGKPVASIRFLAFNGCNNITSITIPDSITSISELSFVCANLISINVDENNPNYKSIDGNLYSKDGTILIQYAIGKTDSSFTISSDVVSIGDGAFAGCTNLVSVEFESDRQCVSIGTWTFLACTNLTSIVIPEGVPSIGYGAFEECTSLASVTFVEPSGWYVTDTEGATSGTDLTLTDVSQNASYLTSTYCNYYWYSTTGHIFGEWTVVKQATCTEPGQKERVCACGEKETKELELVDHVYTSVVTPPTCEEQGYTTHTCGCGDSYVDTYEDATGHSYTSVVTPPTCTEQGYTTHTCKCEDSYIDTYVDALGHSFGEWTTVRESTCTQKGQAERVCDCGGKETKDLELIDHVYTSVVTPPTCTEQGYTTHTCECGDSYVNNYVKATGHNYVDSGCTNCGNSYLVFELSDDETYYIVIGLKKDYTGTVVVIPSTHEGKPVKSIGGNAFENRFKLTSITIPSSVTSIGERAFFNCDSLTNINVDNNNANYKSIDGNLYTKDGKTLIQYTIGKTDTSFAIPECVTSVGNYAFYGCTSLTNITIPGTVTSIGSSVFSGCSKLTKITIPASVTSIGEDAFWCCTSLTNVTILGGITDISDYMFYGCTSLESISISLSVTNIEDYAFAGCSSLENIAIPSNVTRIDEFAFKDCTSLRSIIIPNNVRWIGSGVFHGCTSLTNIEISSRVTDISDHMFFGCTSLESITIPSSVTSIQHYAFEGCTSLTSITIPSSVTSIGEGVFYNCTSLGSITLPFVGANLEGTFDTSFDYIFWSVPSSLKTVVITGGTSIGYAAFEGCASLETITIPSSVKTIDGLAFRNCSNLTTVTFEKGSQCTSIGYNAFQNCTSLKSITIPSSVTSIGIYAFNGCSSLTSVTFNYRTGWYVSRTEGATSGTSLTLTNASTNANYLKNTYSNYYWHKD